MFLSNPKASILLILNSSKTNHIKIQTKMKYQLEIVLINFQPNLMPVQKQKEFAIDRNKIMNLKAINDVQINERPSQVPKIASTNGVIIKLIIYIH